VTGGRGVTGKGVVAVVVVVVLGVLATGTVREIVVGERAIEDCDAAIEKSDPVAAIDAARTAAEALVPGSPYPERGYRRLETIAHDAEMRGDDAVASAAWRAMRTAALATEAVGASSAARLDVANQGLARVGARARVPDAPDVPSDPRPSEEFLLAMLRSDAPPGPGVFVLLAAGAVLFFAGAGRLVWMAGGAGASRLTWRTAGPSLLSAVVGAAAYLLASLH
jgi:hypothetical protein